MILVRVWSEASGRKCSGLAGLVFLGLSFVARGAVVRIELDPTPVQHASDSAKYEVLRGKAYGELNPGDPHNAIIQDIQLAPRNARGNVEYVATFTLYRPAAGEKRSGLLVYEVVNRGGSLAARNYEFGDFFLQSGWQGDIPFGGKSIYGTPGETIKVPAAHNPDGSSVTGPVLARFANVRPATNTLPIRAATGYATSGVPPLPVTLDTAQSELTTRTYENVDGAVGGVHVIPSTDWAWADCSETPFPGKSDPAKICVRDGFRPDLLYQLRYTARDPLVLGIGLAAMRDVVSFFRNANADERGTPNPIAGQVSHAIGVGISQSGNLVRTFLNLGFNQDEQGRRVWDGAMPIIAARQTPLNLRFAIPGGASNLYEPGSDGTVWWAHWPNVVRGGGASGLLDRCSATATCPKIMEVMGSSEFYALRASPDYVGTSGEADIPLPANVRRYYIAGTQHGGGPGGFHWKPVEAAHRSAASNPIESEPCLLPPNPNPMPQVIRALFYRLRTWVVANEAPPPSVYPKLADHTLLREEDLVRRFPFIPNVPSPQGIANPTLVYDFGPQFNGNDMSGAITKEPPQVIGVLPTFLPSIDADGNENAGIQTIQGQAPLGTYLGWNVTAAGFSKGQFCSLTGSYIPFAATRQERLANHDPRPSLEERYGTHDRYVERVRKAVEKSVADGFILPDDAAKLIRTGKGQRRSQK